VTDDSHPARRGGGPLREDPDATADVVQHPAVSGSPDATPGAAEVPAQRPDPAYRYGPQPAYQPAPPPTYPQSAPPAVPPTPTAHPAPQSPSAAATPPAPANRVTSGTPSAGYGPFRTGDPSGGGNPTAAPATWNAGPPGTEGAPGQAYSGTPTSGAGPTYGPSQPPTPAYGINPTSGAGPAYGPSQPHGPGTPLPETTPTSGSTPTWSAADPISGSAPLADPYGFSVTPGPRIEPTPKQPKSRFVIPALAGLLAGLVLFGTGGWFLGRSTAGGADPAPAPTRSAPAPSAAVLPPYEQNQVTINQPKFTGPLAVVAQGWLPYLSGCSRSGEKDGPALNKGEKARVRCEMDAMSVIFVEYATVADRDKARVKTLGQNVDARTLTPGAAGAAVERATPSGRTNGNYVEYAYQTSGRTVSGIWWDDSASPVAAYLLAYWKEGTGQKWEPMRDVWARYA